MNTIKSLALLSLPLLSIACDSQADSDYQGEALASVKGQVTTSLSSLPSDYEALVVWNNSAGSPDTFTGQSVDVSGSFPANFELNIFLPPPQEALNDYTQNGQFPDESHIGVAFIAALPVGLDLQSDEEFTGPGAISEDYMLVYVQEDVKPGTVSEQLLGEALTAGYYLMKVIDVDDPACPGEVFDCLRVAPQGMNSQVELHITSDEIDAPNWT